MGLIDMLVPFSAPLALVDVVPSASKVSHFVVIRKSHSMQSHEVPKDAVRWHGSHNMWEWDSKQSCASGLLLPSDGTQGIL